MNGLVLAASLASAAAVAACTALLVRPTPRLALRVRPYRTGSAGDPVVRDGTALSMTVLRRLCAPLIDPVLARLSTSERDAGLARRLEQAGLMRHLPPSQRVTEHRLSMLSTAALHGLMGGLAGAVVFGPTGAVVVAALGAVHGASRVRSAVDRALDARRAAMRLELYTLNQLLGLHIRVGGGVAHAISQVVARSRGAVVSELAEVLAAQRGGRPLAAALHGAAARSPEPHAARTYQLLAAGAEHGADLAAGLRRLSEDIRDQRVEDLKRAATKRRAAMLLPIIAVLAPVMLLFVAAPLPRIIFGSG